MLNTFTESWIELTNNLIQNCPDRVTPPLPFSSGEEYLRLLKEAQRESNPSSLISSRRDSPKVGSPKSPPNSPNPEPSTNEEELRGVFINYYAAKVSSMSKRMKEESMNFQFSTRRRKEFSGMLATAYQLSCPFNGFDFIMLTSPLKLKMLIHKQNTRRWLFLLLIFA